MYILTRLDNRVGGDNVGFASQSDTNNVFFAKGAYQDPQTGNSTAPSASGLHLEELAGGPYRDETNVCGHATRLKGTERTDYHKRDGRPSYDATRYSSTYGTSRHAGEMNPLKPGVRRTIGRDGSSLVDSDYDPIEARPLTPGESYMLKVERVYGVGDKVFHDRVTDRVSVRFDKEIGLHVHIEDGLDPTGSIDAVFPLSSEGNSWIVASVKDNSTPTPEPISIGVPRASIALAAYSAFTANLILRGKLRELRKSSKDGNELLGRSFSPEFDSESYSTKPALNRGQSEECCVPHDMQCTRPAANMLEFDLGICEVHVDLSDCCIKHDLAMWCGPREGRKSSKAAYAWETSNVLGACVSSKIIRTMVDQLPWYCGGAPVAILIGAPFSIVTAMVYSIVTFIWHLTGPARYVSWNGENDHCCVCGGDLPTKCCSDSYKSPYGKRFCENPKTEEPRFLCNPGECSGCTRNCYYRIEPDGSAVAYDYIAAIHDTNLDLCPECKGFCFDPGDCVRWTTRLDADTVDRLKREDPDFHDGGVRPGAPYGTFRLVSRCSRD